MTGDIKSVKDRHVWAVRQYEYRQNRHRDQILPYHGLHQSAHRQQYTSAMQQTTEQRSSNNDCQCTNTVHTMCLSLLQLYVHPSATAAAAAAGLNTCTHTHRQAATTQQPGARSNIYSKHMQWCTTTDDASTGCKTAYGGINNRDGCCTYREGISRSAPGNSPSLRCVGDVGSKSGWRVDSTACPKEQTKLMKNQPSGALPPHNTPPSLPPSDSTYTMMRALVFCLAALSMLSVVTAACPVRVVVTSSCVLIMQIPKAVYLIASVNDVQGPIHTLSAHPHSTYSTLPQLRMPSQNAHAIASLRTPSATTPSCNNKQCHVPHTPQVTSQEAATLDYSKQVTACKGNAPAVCTPCLCAVIDTLKPLEGKGGLTAESLKQSPARLSLLFEECLAYVCCICWGAFL